MSSWIPKWHRRMHCVTNANLYCHHKAGGTFQATPIEQERWAVDRLKFDTVVYSVPLDDRLGFNATRADQDGYEPSSLQFPYEKSLQRPVFLPLDLKHDALLAEGKLDAHHERYTQWSSRNAHSLVSSVFKGLKGSGLLLTEHGGARHAKGGPPEADNVCCISLGVPFSFHLGLSRPRTA